MRLIPIKHCPHCEHTLVKAEVELMKCEKCDERFLSRPIFLTGVIYGFATCFTYGLLNFVFKNTLISLSCTAIFCFLFLKFLNMFDKIEKLKSNDLGTEIVISHLKVLFFGFPIGMGLLLGCLKLMI